MQLTDPIDRDRFPADPWRLVDRRAATASSSDPSTATLFSLANGYVGVRADGDMTRGLGHGVFINGFHETYWIHHPEQAYGFARVGQVIQGVPDACGVEITVDDTDLRTDSAHLVSSEQVLDFHTGTVERVEEWDVPTGRVRVNLSRMVALFNAHLALVEVCVTPLDGPCRIGIRFRTDETSAETVDDAEFLDPRLADHGDGAGLDRISSHMNGNTCFVRYQCRNSRLTVAMAAHTTTDQATSIEVSEDGQWSAHTVTDQPVNVVRYLAYCADSVPPNGVVHGLSVVDEHDTCCLETQCADVLTWAINEGKDKLRACQRAYLSDFWSRSDVVVHIADPLSHLGQAATQQAIRWNLFQLAQVSAFTRDHGIAAKGLSGSGYSGHYFWDTEIFVLPFLIYTDPSAARDILAFRHAMLPAARRRAQVMDCKGALFPWRTINGEESSAYYPAGTAQYHIDADIAYGTYHYWQISGDDQFMTECGVDILAETARMWLSLGFFGNDGHFHIHAVTGPDEYSAVVDDNFYTNAMAAFNLKTAARAAADLKESGICARLGVSDAEISSWLEAAQAMYLPWDETHGVHPQDAQFLTRQPWDFTASSDDPRPLLLRYHPLVIYRHQVIKQADTILALQLLSDQFTREQKEADFAYYEPLTTGDSSLSSTTQAIVAAEVGRGDLALSHLNTALFTDLGNLHGNTDSGVHIATSGGVWNGLISGFGGLRDDTGTLSLAPHLPTDWDCLEFPLRVKTSHIAIRITHTEVSVTLLEGDPVDLVVMGRTLHLDSHNPAVSAQYDGG